MVCRYFGAGPGHCPAAGHPFAQLWWAWSGAVATRGVNQEGDHAVGGSDKIATAHGLRPECSRRPVWVERTDVAVAQPVVDQREQFACRGDLGDVLAAASFDTVLVGGDLGCRLVPLHRLDRRPADQFGALFGDMPAVHDGVGLAVAWGQPGPGAQLGGPGEAVHVTDLGDEHRRQHRSDTGYLLDGLIAAISVELFGDQRGEPRLVAIEDVDEFQQRAHPFGVSSRQWHLRPAVGDQ